MSTPRRTPRAKLGRVAQPSPQFHLGTPRGAIHNTTSGNGRRNVRGTVGHAVRGGVRRLGTSGHRSHAQIVGRAERRRDQRGDVVQTVIIAPVLMLTLMAIIQFALMFHARNVAEQAAQEGVASARTFDSTAAQARTQTEHYLAALPDAVLKDRDIDVDRSPTTARVTVSGTALSLVPGLTFHVHVSAAGPVERYVAPSEGEDR